MTRRAWEPLGLQWLDARRDAVDLTQLGELWGECFGTAARDWQWVNRKLHREFWRRDVSTVLVDARGRLAAFFLVGAASEPVAHAIALGVHPEHRGHGLGRALIEHSCEAIRTSRLDALECEVMPGARSVYLEAGLEPGERRAHLLHEATGEPDLDQQLGGRPKDARSLWRPRCWDRTALPDKLVLEDERGRCGLSRETSAWLMHWTTLELDAAGAWARQSLPTGERIVIYGVPENDPARAALSEAGWRAVQTFELFRRELPNPDTAAAS